MAEPSGGDDRRVLVTSFATHFAECTSRPMSSVAPITVNFVLSGIFYEVLYSAGRGLLEDIQLTFVSLTTVAIFVLKHRLI
ncbi:hypothetical protein B4589_004555 [Halolamina sp. CBA1230]|uniref:hypothetical protein n=1 Tax=Halolamina sp. CBA1230 TaxID=1853690 RepID=UPI00117AA782|nr:hypothetical protein [Halolamina sp. CBA1230]QKY19684.1 hypothetical protein B4589_004555 [Halolamina sp. CBA1230]